MLGILDRNLKAWHVAAVSVAAIGWFAGMTIASHIAMPGIALFRCPIGFCVTGYSANSVALLLRRIGLEGREFLQGTLLPLDRVLPVLVLAAALANYAWWTRPHGARSVKLEPVYRLVMMAVPIVYCVVDYLENWAFTALLHSFPDINYRAVRLASIFTAAKSQLIAATLGIILALMIAAWFSERDPK